MAVYSHNVLCITPAMTANNAPSPVVVSASDETSPNNLVYRAFDQIGSGEPWYIPDTAVPQWFKVDLGSGNVKSIESYTITSPDNNSSYPGMPTEWTIKGSNTDNYATATELDSVTGEAAWGDGEMRTYTLASASAEYRYFWLYMTAREGVIYGWQILEVELIGAEVPTSTLSITELEVYEFTSSITEILVSETASITDAFSGDVWTSSTIAEIVTLTDTMTAYYLRDSINESISLTDVMIGSMLHDLIDESTSFTDIMSAIVGNEVRRRRVKVNW